MTPTRTPPTETTRRRKVLPPAGGDKKRKADPSEEAEGSKKGRNLPPNRATTAADCGDEWLLRVKTLVKS